MGNIVPHFINKFYKLSSEVEDLLHVTQWQGRESLAQGLLVSTAPCCAYSLHWLWAQIKRPGFTLLA